MNKEQAIDLAVRWWERMIVSGHWDNGDGHTESLRHGLASLIGRATDDDMEKCRPFLRALLEQKAEQPGMHGQMYADYGCHELDVVYGKAMVNLTSTFHCPQKAGTYFVCSDGSWQVVAKNGYGKDWEVVVST